MRVCFLIRQLNVGGAQRQLCTLIHGMDKSACDVTVMTFYRGGLFFDEVAAIPGVRCVDLGKKCRWDVLLFMIRLVLELRAARPDVLCTYLGTSNILSTLVKPFLPGTRIVWSVRASNMDWERYSWLHLLMYRIECFLSRFAGLVIANSSAGRDYAVANGFPGKRTVVIPNGIDTVHFSIDLGAGRGLRIEWGVGDGEVLIGLVGRIDPMKDHPTFLNAAAILAREHKNVKFVCVGNGQEGYARQMRGLGESLGLTDRLTWAGTRNDMPAVYNALDILASSSFTEGFPNSIAEAMACGLPCAVTDVGDCREIVGELGVVVPARDPEALAAGLAQVISDTKSFGRETVRARIVALFNMKQMISRTEEQLCCL